MFRTRYCFAHSSSFHHWIEKLLLLLLNTNTPRESRCGTRLSSWLVMVTWLAWPPDSISEIALNRLLRSSLLPKSLRNIHPETIRWAKCQTVAKFSVKLKSLSGQQLSGSQVACTSASLAGGYHLPSSRTCWHGFLSEQPALSTHGPPPNLTGTRSAWRVRRKPPILSWHRKFIAVHRHTNQILHARVAGVVVEGVGVKG